MPEFVKANLVWIIPVAYLAIGAVAGFVMLNMSVRVESKDGRMYPDVDEFDKGFAAFTVFLWPLMLVVMPLVSLQDKAVFFMIRRGYHPKEWILFWPWKIAIIRRQRKEAANADD